MIEFKLDSENLILYIKPLKRLDEKDFEEIAAEIDPIILAQGSLEGIIIETDSFPFWKNISSMLEHFKFVKNHHKKISKIALVTDSHLIEFSKMFVQSFVQPKLQQFPSGQVKMAKEWILEK